MIFHAYIDNIQFINKSIYFYYHALAVYKATPISVKVGKAQNKNAFIHMF